MKPAALLCLALALTAGAQGPDRDFPSDLRVRGYLQRGIAEFRVGNMIEAARYFQRAVDASPESSMAHVYLGISYANQYDPNGAGAANAELAKRAEAQFQKVLSVDARDETALTYLANLYYQMGGAEANYTAKVDLLDRAAALYNRLADVRPENRQTQFNLGVIAWLKWHQPWLDARARAGLRPEDPGPLKDPALRRDLTARFGAVLDDGIMHLQAAAAMDPMFLGALEYLDLLIREKADLADSPAAYAAAIEDANRWAAQLSAARKRMSPP